MSELLWWIALTVLAFALGLAIVAGPCNLTTGAAFLATGLVIVAAVVEGAPRNDRRPW